MKKQINEKKQGLITHYQTNILKPLNTLYTSHYKDIVQKKDEENWKILDQEYDLYLEKLENFWKLIESESKNI